MEDDTKKDISEDKAMSLGEYVRRMNEHHRFCLELFSKPLDKIEIPPGWEKIFEKNDDDSNL